ncbi:MAG: hypothetical protein LQ342_003141 [Letrouitia transgressa]|nr:MAG: hypothetical protein LQ342_003141 [Letrouitia transgressa]
MDHPAAHQIPGRDLEKSAGTLDVASKDSTEDSSQNFAPPAQLHVPPTLSKWNARIESLAGLEARGITRVLPHERHAISLLGYTQMALLWFSANLSANNLGIAMLGPLYFQLSFLDSAMCAVFGAFVGSLATSYMSYGVIDCIIGGQILSAVSGGSMTIVVGIIIVAFVSWVVAVFGMAIFHVYERWAWIPQLMVLFILVGSAGPEFNTATPSTGDVTAGRLSYFSLALSVSVSWCAASSDFYVYYPEKTKSWTVFLMTLTGLTLAFSFVNLLGIGLASGVATNPAWADANSISSGALILAGYSGLRGFGKFCGVIVALGVIANNIPGTYASALGCQVLGRYGKAVPRYVWVCVIVAIYFVCAIAGREHLFQIFENFVALMGYWCMIFVALVLEEHLLFKPKLDGALDWTAWENQKRLPVGVAALIAFLAGWAGAIIGMYQNWYVGPVAIKVGTGGADIGVWLGCAFAMVLYPPLRMAELRVFGR